MITTVEEHRRERTLCWILDSIRNNPGKIWDYWSEVKSVGSDMQAILSLFWVLRPAAHVDEQP